MHLVSWRRLRVIIYVWRAVLSFRISFPFQFQVLDLNTVNLEGSNSKSYCNSFWVSLQVWRLLQGLTPPPNLNNFMSTWGFSFSSLTAPKWISHRLLLKPLLVMLFCVGLVKTEKYMRKYKILVLRNSNQHIKMYFSINTIL